MNGYKKLIRSRDTRLRMLELLAFVPDELMIRCQYRLKTGRSLNLESPRRYTEKLQWYKLNYRDPRVVVCSDKYEVRSYVQEKGYEHILNELHAVYESADEIDFNTLPNAFAMKLSVGSGMNIFVEDKESVSTEQLRGQVREWFQRRPHVCGREWGYQGAKSRVVVERLLPRDCNNDLRDYKFFCFDGRVYCLYVMMDYVDDHSRGRLGFYDTQFRRMPYNRADFLPIVDDVERPANFDEMLKIAGDLSVGFPHVRVDFFAVGGLTVFGEMTFYNASGYTVFEPDEFDVILGAQFRLPSSMR